MDRPLPGIEIPQCAAGILDIGMAGVGQLDGAATAIE
jgi:hypothetical protein